MSLTVNDQLMLLNDILGEHSEDCCGEVAEYQQIKRIVKNLMAKKQLSDEQLLQLLPEIYNYGRQGEIAQNVPEHITTNQGNLENWMNAIANVSMK